MRTDSASVALSFPVLGLPQLVKSSSYHEHSDSMLRIITGQAEAYTELQRIGDRHCDEEIRAKEAIVRDILETVKREGDRSLLDYRENPDNPPPSTQQLRVSGSELDAAYQQVSKELLDAIRLACQQIEAFHRQRIPKSWVQFGDNEVVLGKRYTPVELVGLYISGRSAANLSTVLMQAIPARVARVSRVVMVTPPNSDRKIHPALLVAAQEAGIGEIYRIGGAQAIAALAYGTETIPRVDLIVGHGDFSVTLAKKMVYQTVGIDSLASLSELLIIADDRANPVQVAVDLVAQAEQDPLAAAILLTTDPALAQAVQQSVEQQLKNHPQRILTEKAIAHYGLIGVVNSLEEAAELSNLFAPEHLELNVDDPWTLLEQIRHAGAIFLGASTPKGVGDYLGGSVTGLPISGAARYASALGVETFMKSSNLVQYSPIALKKMSNMLEILARAEGFSALADSIRLRISDFDF